MCELLADICYMQWNGWELKPQHLTMSVVQTLLDTITNKAVLLLLCKCRHADGKVSFWDMNLSATTTLMYCLDMASIFDTDADNQESSSSPAEEDWPPFRKVDSVYQNCDLYSKQVAVALTSSSSMLVFCWTTLFVILDLNFTISMDICDYYAIYFGMQPTAMPRSTLLPMELILLLG